MTGFDNATGATSRAETDVAALRLVYAAALAPTDSTERSARRAEAILAWTPLAHRLARRYAADHNRREDLEQTAVIGLIKAVDGFDPQRGNGFVAYAVPMIVGELKRYFRDRCWILRPPRPLHNRYMHLEAASRQLTQRLGRSPTVTDLAAHLDLTVEEVVEGLECRHARRAASLSAPVYHESNTELSESIGSEDAGYRTAEQRLDLRQAIGSLDERRQRVVTQYFYGNLKQSEIGRQMGVSQMHVSRLLRSALDSLRSELAVR